jgi:Agrobacterium tumefaciens protein Atu4866
MQKQAPYLGMWVTRDGYIRQELLPDGRYDEARGKTKSAYTGSYVIKGNHIKYRDDSGFSATGDFMNGVLYHGGHTFYKVDIAPYKENMAPASISSLMLI